MAHQDAPRFTVNPSAGAAQATKTEAEAESNVDKYLPPDLIKDSPGVAKAWCYIIADGTLQSPDYNLASVTDTGTGDRTLVWETDFSSTVYVVVIGSDGDDGDKAEANAGSLAVGTFQVRTSRAGTAADIRHFTAAFGDQ